MPVIANAKKALRVSRRKAAINKPVKSKARTMLKKALQSPTTELASEAFSSIDKAEKRNIFHKNTAARMKRRISKALKATQS